MPSTKQISTTPLAARDQWRWIPGYEGIYYATLEGRVFSFYSRGSNKALIEDAARELIGGADKDGYRKLILCKGGEHKHVRLHIAVALAFIGPQPAGTVCCHLDGNLINNRPENLSFVSQRENIGHKTVHGTMLFGIRSPSSKLQDEEVLFIRSDSRALQEIATSFGVSKSCVKSIRARRSWKHLQ